MFIDITKILKPSMAVYEGDPKFENDEIFSIERDGFNLNKISMGTHTGSHIDAPLHFIKNGMSVSEIDDKYFFTNTFLADVSKYKFIDSEVLKKYNLSEVNSLIFKTDSENIFLTKDGAEYILKTGIMLVGTDNMDIEDESCGDFSVHKTLLRNNILIAENLDLKNISEGFYKLYCFPLKIENADGSPIRAFLEK